MRRHLQDLSPSRAAVAGVITHLPGLVYLAALNAIVGDATLNGIVQVLVYNAIWYSVPVVALVLSMHNPAVARECLAMVASWTRRHRQVIMVVFLSGLGSYLLAVGVQAWPSRPA